MIPSKVIQDFSLTEEQERLRAEVEAFCREHINDDLIERTWGAGEPHSDEFYKALIDTGYVGLGWPEEYGSLGRDRLDISEGSLQLEVNDHL